MRRLVLIGAPTDIGAVGSPTQRVDHLNKLAAFLAEDDFEGLMRYHMGRVFSEPDVADLAASRLQRWLEMPRATALSFFIRPMPWSKSNGPECVGTRRSCIGSGSELLLALPQPDQAQAENCFRQALAVAREQDAKMWELRAATSLSRLWAGQGKRAMAHDLLAPIYGWFTEGFETADLRTPKLCSTSYSECAPDQARAHEPRPDATGDQSAPTLAPPAAEIARNSSHHPPPEKP